MSKILGLRRLRRSLSIAMASALVAVLLVPAATASPSAAPSVVAASDDGSVTVRGPQEPQRIDVEGLDLGRTDRLIIHRGASDRAGQATERLSQLTSGGTVVRTTSTGHEILELPEEMDLAAAESLAAELVAAGLVGSAEPDARVTITGTPNDPYYPYQWGPTQVGMPEAWDITVGGAPGPVVAVLDTGVREVSELSGRVLDGWNVDTATTNTEDVNGHGTMTATVLAAKGNNNQGIAGQCWTCRILPVKVLQDDGSGTSSDVGDGIRWAADNGATIINMSLGGSSDSTYVASAVDYATDRGVTLVASAGNDGEEGVLYPAAYDGVISVGGSDRQGRAYLWSNRGSEVDVAAPGCNVAQAPDEKLYWYIGTSSAAPLVSGLVALQSATHPDHDPATLRQRLQDASSPVDWVAHGVIHGPRTLNGEVATGDGAFDEPVTTPALSGSLKDLSVSLRWSEASGGCGGYGYTLHRSTTSTCTASSPRIAGWTSSRSFTDTGLDHDRTYRYCVRTLDVGGADFPLSNTVKITTPKPASPSWPSDARLAFDLASGGVTIAWPAAKGEISHYQVFRDGSHIANTTSRKRTVSNLKNGQRYLLEVRAVDKYGQLSPRLSIHVTPTSGFRDVSSTATFAQDIRWLATGEITRGCNPPTNDRFCPDRDVTREQMAAFMVRALGLTESSGVRFRDVPRGSTFEADIDRLATAGITKGCNPPTNDRFCPDREVTREQMAAFMVRALGLTESSGVRFRDVPRGSTFEADIDRLATAGITKGCNPPTNDRFCPDREVTREQMSAFLRRALGA